MDLFFFRGRPTAATAPRPDLPAACTAGSARAGAMLWLLGAVSPPPVDRTPPPASRFPDPLL